jgi:hypothetical protein
MGNFFMEPLTVTQGTTEFTENQFECHSSGVPIFITQAVPNYLFKKQQSIIRQTFSKYTVPLSNLIPYVSFMKS